MQVSPHHMPFDISEASYITVCKVHTVFTTTHTNCLFASFKSFAIDCFKVCDFFSSNCACIFNYGVNYHCIEKAKKINAWNAIVKFGSFNCLCFGYAFLFTIEPHFYLERPFRCSIKISLNQSVKLQSIF